MSKIAGISTKDEPFYHQTEGWKDVATLFHIEVKSVFELQENSYGFIRSFLEDAPKDRKKFYLLVAKQGLYLVKYLGRGKAAQVSKLADLSPDLDEASRREMERKARLNASGFDAFLDCGVMVAGWVFGAYTGGVFLLIAGVGASAKCVVSATKFVEAYQGRDQSIFDSTAGQVVDVTVSVVNLVGSAGAAYKTGAKAITHWSKVGQSISPSINSYHAWRGAMKVSKFVLVELPGLALGAYDLMTKYQGLSISGDQVQQLLDQQEDSRPTPPCVPYEPMFRSPTDWLRETIDSGFVHLPWSEACRP